MKVLDYYIKGDFIHVHTDNPGRPDFVYLAKKFGTAEELEAEINRSIAFEAERKLKDEESVRHLVSRLNDHLKKDKDFIDLGEL